MWLIVQLVIKHLYGLTEYQLLEAGIKIWITY